MPGMLLGFLFLAHVALGVEEGGEGGESSEGFFGSPTVRSEVGGRSDSADVGEAGLAAFDAEGAAR